MYTNTHVLFSLACFSVLFNALLVVSKEPQVLYLNCGSDDGGADGDGRKWESDAKYIAGNYPGGRAKYQDSSIVSEVPYMDGRIFTSEATYKLPIKPKTRYWLRLHFYPTDYSSLNISKSYFSVVAAGVTLLNNFSASITAQALTQAYLIREYSLAPMESDELDVTFRPAADKPESFAFVNGIELIPIPELFGSGTMVGFEDQTFDATSSNLQTMYRLNVGGQMIPPNKDSGGLARTWYNDMPYLYGAATGMDLQTTDNLKINYGDLPEYAAPADVYATARGMGNSKDLNLQYNLTWLFQVDANFTYIVRLHFCEFNLTKINQKVFDIYINNKTAQVDPPADIIGWTGKIGMPTYKDYAVFVTDSPGDEEIWVALHPSTELKPEYYDASVNGIEIFKMSDAKKNLAGLNPELSAMLARDVSENDPKAFKSNNKAVMKGAAGGAAGFALVAAICIAVYQRKKRLPGPDSHTSSWLPIYSHITGSKSTISGKSNSSHLSTLAQGLCRHFTLPEIKKATRNFDESNVIGVGGFGKVYKGVIDQTVKVAIKRSNPQSEQGVNEFRTEIEMLSKLRHKHLVSLIGFCEEDNEMCLVYDYMALGTMREHLYNSKKPKLSWKRRLEICIGAARGLHYLHTGAKYTIIHRDVKTTNILLDENWVAKVSDFGLSKTGPNMEKGHVSTVVKGSFGYLDPEYFKRQQLTEKSDVYSLGVVLFEALCSRPALNPNLPKEQVSLADWALHCQRKGTLEDIVDPHIKKQIKPECLKKFADTAEKCLADSGIERPSMGDVLWNLEFALQLQDNADDSKHSSISEGSVTSEESVGKNLLSHHDNPRPRSDHEISIPSDGSTDIFSQVANPKGR